VVAAGYGTHRGLFQLQKKLEEMNVMWFARFAGVGSDAKETRTAIGAIGRLKLSNRIVLRGRTDGGAPPELLREASYNIYRAPLWTTGLRREFGRILSEPDDETWLLLPEKKSRRAVTIAQYQRRGEGLLALPPGASEVGQLPVAELSTNLFGATLVKGGPGLIVYNARYDDGPTIDSEPNADDLRSYRDTEPAVAVLAQELQLRPGLSPEEAMRRVARLFRERFQYSTYRSQAHVAQAGQTAMERFLVHTRSGHCEYFATATALLLREAGLPTRYAVGYAVEEGKGRKFVVRARHAHAWTLVYYNNTWHDFDTTPGSWNAVESQRQPWFQPVKDLMSDLWFQFSRFRWSKTEWRKYFMWAPLPVFVLVLARFFLGKQWKRFRAARDEQQRQLSRPGIDSDFYLIEKFFAARGLERRPGENWRDWLRRIEQHESAAARLDRVLWLHHRHRFDPRGLSAEERAELRTAVLAWLSDIKRRG
jgi:transglutaminase-like putative cysteine protease